MDLRFDKCNHWPDRDKKISRSRCKMEGCNLITHVLCTKCKVHLCFTTNRNCFVPYHLAIVATPQLDKEARSNTKNKESVKPAPSQINQNGKTKTKTIDVGKQYDNRDRDTSGISGSAEFRNRQSAKAKIFKASKKKIHFFRLLNLVERKSTKMCEKSKKCGKVKS